MRHGVWGLATLALVASLLLLSCGPKQPDTNAYKLTDAAGLTALVKEQKAVVVDTMSYLECMDHRIPGSLCIAFEEFGEKAPLRIPDKKQPVVLYCESEECPRALWTYEKAKRLGYGNLYILSGGLAAWKRAGYEVETVERVKRAPVVSIKADRLRALVKEKSRIFILDIRSEDEFRKGHVEGAVNIPLYRLHAMIREVPRDIPVVVIDESGKRSFLASCYLVNNGVNHVTRLFGGMKSMSAPAGRKG